jgi:hypothetical protein
MGPFPASQDERFFTRQQCKEYAKISQVGTPR